MHRDRPDVVLALELAGQLVGAVLRPHEHEREAAVAAELLDQAVELVLGGDGDEGVVDLAALRLGGRLGPDVRGLDGVGAGELGDGSVERGREEHRLPVVRDAAKDAVDLRLEAHVEHPVGLVEDEDPDVVRA